MKLKPKYFEDFEVGLNFESEPTLITKEEIVDFASKYDPQSFHLDEEAAKNGPFGQLTSSGFMTLGKSFTQIFKTGVYDGTSMGAWGIDELRWTKPVYPGDLLKTKIEVLEARISHLAYAPEVAQAMLRRQQASAVVAARREIVDGAVGMVELALDQLSVKGIIELDEDKKATIVSNLLVVLCSETDTTPVVNTGSLYQ